MLAKCSCESLLVVVISMASSLAMAQTMAPLPTRLEGTYTFQGPRRLYVIPLELSSIKAEGENVTGVVSSYRSPQGNCLSDNTPFKGTYKDGTLSIKSDRLKSQFADERPCGGLTLEVKVADGRASGTMKIGNDTSRVELEAK